MADGRYLESSLSQKELEDEQFAKVKIDGKKSRFSKQPEQPSYNFKERARDIQNKFEGYLAEAFEYGKEYKEVLADKTLKDEKSFLNKSREEEIVAKLIDFAIKVNNDENEPEGQGSVTIIVLLLKCLYTMRDKYNDIEYKYYQLEKNHIKLEEKFNRLDEKINKSSSRQRVDEDR